MNEIKTRKLNDLKLLLEKTEIEVEIKNKYIDEINDFIDKIYEKVDASCILSYEKFIDEIKKENLFNFFSSKELKTLYDMRKGYNTIKDFVEDYFACFAMEDSNLYKILKMDFEYDTFSYSKCKSILKNEKSFKDFIKYLKKAIKNW